MKAFFFEARGGLVIIHLRLVTCECLYFGIATSFLGRSGETVQRRIAKFLLVITKHHITTMLRMTKIRSNFTHNGNLSGTSVKSLNLESLNLV